MVNKPERSHIMDNENCNEILEEIMNLAEERSAILLVRTLIACSSLDKELYKKP